MSDVVNITQRLIKNCENSRVFLCELHFISVCCSLVLIMNMNYLHNQKKKILSAWVEQSRYSSNRVEVSLWMEGSYVL